MVVWYHGTIVAGGVMVVGERRMDRVRGKHERVVVERGTLYYWVICCRVFVRGDVTYARHLV